MKSIAEALKEALIAYSTEVNRYGNAKPDYFLLLAKTNMALAKKDDAGLLELCEEVYIRLTKLEVASELQPKLLSIFSDVTDHNLIIRRPELLQPETLSMVQNHPGIDIQIDDISKVIIGIMLAGGGIYTTVQYVVPQHEHENVKGAKRMLGIGLGVLMFAAGTAMALNGKRQDLSSLSNFWSAKVMPVLADKLSFQLK